MLDIKFCKEFTKNHNNIVLFIDDTFSLIKDANNIKKLYQLDVLAILKNCNFEGNFGETVIIPTDKSDLKSIIIVSVGKVSELDQNKFIKLGSKIYLALAKSKLGQVGIYTSSLPCDNFSEEKIISFISFGLQLRSYKFDKYFTDKKKKAHLPDIEIVTHSPEKTAACYHDSEAIVSGITMAKNLINEPSNIKYPESFAKQCESLKELGIEVEVLDEKKMQTLGMNALLGVAQGSVKKPRLVIMKWNGGKKDDNPIAICGKGVTFDSGGLSLKPAESMETMKYDMAGAAVVTGLMKTLALRKAKANIVGVIGLVENMPDGDAQKPGDVVTTMSGQTIEVLNTDAEGRLVLADVLWYTQSVLNPKLMIDLATLTGAIVVTFAGHYAGLFSNDDKLSEQLTAAGNHVDEKLWRLPLGPEFDKMIESTIADMQNIARGGGGSITAAQLLQKFVNKKPWAHLDIAGAGWSKTDNDYHEKGSTGFGLRLLNQFIIDNYEK